MAPKPPPFPGELGFTLLRCVAEKYDNRGKVTGCPYHFVEGQRRYVDARDLSGMDRGAFEREGDADSDSEVPGTQESA